MRALLAALLLLPGVALAAPRVPSGQPVSLMEVIWPAPGASGKTVARFRFLAPALKKGAANAADLQALCDQVAVPEVKKHGGQVDQIVVSLSSQPLKFGESNPNVAQVIEAFVVKAGVCQEAEPW